MYIFFTALGLAMDAFAATVVMGAKFKNLILRLVLLCFLFGLFQGLMPVIGYFLGLPFETIIAPFDHWIAFVILCFLGFNMMFDWQHNEEHESELKMLTWKSMFTLAVATSIDALVVGIGIHALGWSIVESAIIIGITTFVVCLPAIVIGKYFGERFNVIAEKFGGGILVLLGVKILVTHLFF